MQNHMNKNISDKIISSTEHYLSLILQIALATQQEHMETSDRKYTILKTPTTCLVETKYKACLGIKQNINLLTHNNITSIAS